MTAERWRMGLVCAVAAVAGALGGAWSSSRASAQPPAAVVTATQVNVVDGQGRLKAVLSGGDERGATSLSFYDPGGQLRMSLSTDSVGLPLIQMFTVQGAASVTIAQPGGMDGSIVVGDLDGPRATVATSQSAPIVALSGGGATPLLLQLQDETWPAVMLSAAQSQVRLQVGPDGTPAMTIYRDGRARAMIAVVENASFINLSDDARPRLVAGVAQNGRPSVNFLDEAGRLVRELP